MAGADVRERLAALPGVARCTITDDSVVLVAAPEADARLLRARAQAVCGDLRDPRALIVTGGRGHFVATKTTATPVHFGGSSRPGRSAMVVAASLVAFAAVAMAPSDDGRSPVGGRRSPGISSAAPRPPDPAAAPSGDGPEPVAGGVALGAAPALGAPVRSGSGTGALPGAVPSGTGGLPGALPGAVPSGTGGLPGALPGGVSPAVAPAAASPVIDDRPRPALLAVARSRPAFLRLISSFGRVVAGISVREVALGSPAPEGTSTAADGEPPSGARHAAGPSHAGPPGDPAAPVDSGDPAQAAREPQRTAPAASSPSPRLHPRPAAPRKGGPSGGGAHPPGRTEQEKAHEAGGAEDRHRGAGPPAAAAGGSGRSGGGSGRPRP